MAAQSADVCGDINAVPLTNIITAIDTVTATLSDNDQNEIKQPSNEVMIKVTAQ